MNRSTAKYLVTACALALSTTTTPVLAADDGSDTSDIWSQASLTTTYTLNRHLNPFKIDVDVNNGIATLRGEVDSDVERDLAEELALGVDGIGEVNNELKVVADASDSQMKQRASTQERGFMRKVEDANITAKVKSQLLWNSNTDGLDIDVDTKNGVVTLSGQVASQAEADLAEQIARNTNDVQRVENNLKVNSEKKGVSEIAALKASQAKQQVSDSWITAKVKSALLYNRGVDGTDIDVDTSDGTVTLRGHVDTSFEKEQAVSISRSIQGVKSVNDQLEGGS